MLLIFRIINSLLNNLISLSDELRNIVSDIEGYKIILFFRNIKFSLICKIKNNNIFFDIPKNKEKSNLIIKLSTRDFIKILFNNKNLKLNIIGQANIAEVFFKIFYYIKINWYKIIIKKINNNYIHIFFRLLEITKNRIFFNKYYLNKIIYEYLVHENIVVSKYQLVAFKKTINDLNKKVVNYKKKLSNMEDIC